MNKVIAWLDARFPLLATWKRYCSEYHVPNNLNLYYCFGVIALLVLCNQLLSGIWLTFFYTPTVTNAFDSIQYIMRDVPYGWLFRYLHSTGASAFFTVLYLHIFRGLLYGSYQKPRELVWLLGVVLFVVILAEAFFGYLLPWGQMSYWGAQVVTSLFEAIPFIGDVLVTWVRGDYQVGQATLQRFFALHVIAVPLILILLVSLHIVALHHVGSNNPDGTDKPRTEYIPFYPFQMLKDLIAIMFFLLVFFAIVFFLPDMAGYFIEPNNAMPANMLQTPEQLTPIWYMAPFYAILRAIPNKIAGEFLMWLSVAMLFVLPWLDKSPVRSMRFKGIYSRCALFGLVVSFIVLGYLGLNEITPLRLCFTRVAILFYFAYFMLMPIYTRREVCKSPPELLT